MKEYVLIFRMDILTPGAQPTPKQMELYMKQWGKWIGWITSQGRLAPGGNHLSVEGVVLRPENSRTDRPYAAGTESVAGYIIIRAEDMEDAVRIAAECPILQGGGTSVEIREAQSPLQEW